jgi:putative nucleotidyltransferase with HDIG domain
MTSLGKNEPDQFDKALRSRERELRSLEERIRHQEEMLSNLNALLEQSDLAISVLTSAQHLFGSGQSVREMADAFLQLACKAARSEAAVLALRDGAKKHFRVISAMGDRQQLVRQHVFGEGDGLMGEVAASGDPVLIPEAAREPRLKAEGAAFIQIEARNALCIPVSGAALNWGALLLVNTLARKRFNRQDIDLQTLLCMRLAREMDREAESANAREDATRFSALLRITEFLHSTSDPQKVYDLLVQLACRLAKAKGAAVFMGEEGNQILACVASSERLTGPVHATMGSGLAGWVALEGQVVNTSLGSDSPFIGQVEPVFKFTADAVLAVLVAANKENGLKFDQSDQSIATILCREAGIALERLSRLIDDQRTIMELLRGIAKFIDAKTPHMTGHSERVAKIAQTLAEEMGMAQAETGQVYMAGLLHDLGNAAMDDEILLAPRRLTEVEQEKMRSHPAVGAEMLQDVKALRNLMPGALYHHERYDGGGYPHGLQGDNIPAVARILAVAEVFDAARTSRSYRKALSLPEALAHIRSSEGTAFDPKVVRALLAAYQRGKLPA